MCDQNQKRPIVINKSIAVLFRNSRVFMDQAMEQYGLSSGQYTYIFFLLDHHGANQEDISRGLELDKASTARALQKLEEAGFVYREQDLKDKRVNRVYLTQKGKNLSKPLIEASLKLQASLLEGVSEAETKQLLSLLEKLTNNVLKSKVRGVK